MSGLAATSDIRASAPSFRLPPSRLTADQAFDSGLMSTSTLGRITSSFIRSRQGGPAGERLDGGIRKRIVGGRRSGQSLHGGRRVGRSLIGDRSHALQPFCSSDIAGAACLTAATMFGIGGATADVAAHVFADVVVVGGVAFLDAGDRRDDLPRRAVPALEGVLIDEGLLHRMQLVALRQSLDGGDLLGPGRSAPKSGRTARGAPRA